MMVESEACELSEDEMSAGNFCSHEQLKPVIDLIIDLAEDAAKEPFAFIAPDYSKLYDAVKVAGENEMRAAFALTDKQERTAAVATARTHIHETLTEDQLADSNIGSAMKKLRSKHTAWQCGTVENGLMDVQQPKSVQLLPKLGLLPRTHGSSLFTRGETQAGDYDAWHWR